MCESELRRVVEGAPQYQKQQGRLLNRRELQGLFVSHGIKLARSISFSVTQRHNGLLVKPKTRSVFELYFSYIFPILHIFKKLHDKKRFAFSDLWVFSVYLVF